nr:MAG TPA: hypothetical protein [Caudoviricetes sp.]
MEKRGQRENEVYRFLRWYRGLSFRTRESGHGMYRMVRI